ncbi:unnamed protein product [Haemonchus placei]|uniref:Ovule protein n=1 Tax=Haemonchus placei TaxID=6290 RepID=A0A0N4WJX5_HAEPC|nr:unnamed protein product [Haemonchus placei]
MLVWMEVVPTRVKLRSGANWSSPTPLEAVYRCEVRIISVVKHIPFKKILLLSSKYTSYSQCGQYESEFL